MFEQHIVPRAEGAEHGRTQLVTKTAGRLNANEALLVALMREGAVEGLASFDAGFDAVEGLRRIS